MLKSVHASPALRPMPLRVKICGLTNLGDARYCAGAGADYLGFIQYPPSPRYIDTAKTAKIIEWIYGPVCVGVFVDADADTVNRAADMAGFHQVQLHGDETPELCTRIDRPIIKALRIAPGSTADDMRFHMDRYAPYVDTFLLDTYDATLRGGTGITFDWRVARALSDTYPILLSGGLGAGNVADAVLAAQPLGVDASSRLEAAPGKKDLPLIDAFFAALRPQAS